MPSFDAENTSRRPSGEMANETGSALKAYSPQREFQVAQAANVTYGSYFNLPEDTGRAREEFKTHISGVRKSPRTAGNCYTMSVKLVQSLMIA